MVHFSASLNIFEVSNVIPKDFLRTKQSMLALTASIAKGGKHWEGALPRFCSLPQCSF